MTSAYLRTNNGPAMCARSGIPSSQTLVCQVLTGNGWTSAASAHLDTGYSDAY
ncbi:hypothetical protein [Actinomadura roseirufa]|uniref:hypothetical protein n=1 Tax=Actinomadura roseirufa TaxID=2094049 RepID=UPI0013F17D24|nr:hypothetical protein [Actinomadura roseirufa]